MQYYLEGLVLGFPLMFLVGPVLLTLLQASIRNGRVSGFAVAVGITVSDLVCLYLCYFGVSRFLSTGAAKFWVELLGGVVLLLFGAGSVFTKPKIPELPPPITSKALFGYFSQGFLVNGVNPFVLLFWTGAMSGAISRYGVSPSKITWFFAGTMTVIFVSDSLKALIADKLKGYLTVRALTWINRFAGIALMGFGIYLIVRVFMAGK